MSTIHLLNVKNGDCTIFEHSSGRKTMIDICAGNIEVESQAIETFREALSISKPKGNYQMCSNPTNPIEYLKNTIGASSLFRFISTHPDMDHLDGFNRLANEISIENFWDSGARKSKPDFEGSPYKEEDWDRYVKFRDGKEYGVNRISCLAGSRFKYANEDDVGGNGDRLHILAPDQKLVDDANETGDGDFNDCSYVILYRSSGGNVIIAGDAHDNTWEYILQNYEDDIKNCKFLLAPHHGRKSNRDYSFLDTMKPKLTLFGCAPSEHLAYSAWNYRNLDYFTQNQCGNMMLQVVDGYLAVYIENEKFAKEVYPNTFSNSLGYFYIRML